MAAQTALLAPEDIYKAQPGTRSKMLREQRQARILEILQSHDMVQVSKITEILGISPVTARRDLRRLARQSLVKRFYGGARLIKAEDPVERYRLRADKFVEEKRRIGARASEFVSDGDSVMLEAGTTVMAVARSLTEKRRLRAVTYSLEIAMELLRIPDLDLTILGGTINRDTTAAVGPLAEQSLSHLRVGKLFLSVGGVDASAGLTAYNALEARINKMMLEAAQRVFIVADNSKFGVAALNTIAVIDSSLTIISDTGVDPAQADAIRSLGAQLILV